MEKRVLQTELEHVRFTLEGRKALTEALMRGEPVRHSGSWVRRGLRRRRRAGGRSGPLGAAGIAGGGGYCWRGRLPLVDGVWRQHSVRRLGRAGRRVGGGLGVGGSLSSSAPVYGLVLLGWLVERGVASSGSGETLDRRCRSRCWRRSRRRSPSGGRHRDPLLADPLTILDSQGSVFKKKTTPMRRRRPIKRF